MTETERRAFLALNGCTFLPGSYDKRFARSFSNPPADYELSEKQRAFLWKLVWKYHRQISSDDLLDIAEDVHEAQQKAKLEIEGRALIAAHNEKIRAMNDAVDKTDITESKSELENQPQQQVLFG